MEIRVSENECIRGIGSDGTGIQIKSPADWNIRTCSEDRTTVEINNDENQGDHKRTEKEFKRHGNNSGKVEII